MTSLLGFRNFRRLFSKFLQHSQLHPVLITNLRQARPFSVSTNVPESIAKAKVAYNEFKEGGPSPQTIFSKIINREIPANIVYEDEKASQKDFFSLPLMSFF